MKIVDFISRWMALIVLVVAAGSLLWPEVFGVIKTAWISYLLGVVMFGMGLTLNLQDFKIVFSRPKDVIIGCIAQFTIMPLLAWALAKTFQLPPELAVGVVLVGCCPGGTASNVITYLAGGDLALSVGMTGVSTILAPVMTPFLTWLFVGTTVDVNPIAMFMSLQAILPGSHCPCKQVSASILDPCHRSDCSCCRFGQFHQSEDLRIHHHPCCHPA